MLRRTLVSLAVAIPSVAFAQTYDPELIDRKRVLDREIATVNDLIADAGEGETRAELLELLNLNRRLLAALEARDQLNVEIGRAVSELDLSDIDLLRLRLQTAREYDLTD